MKPSEVGLTFDPVKHRYFFNGRPVPNVTTVLKDQGMLVISPYSTGPDTGRAVHTAVHADGCGYFNPAHHPELVKPYMDAYAVFKDAVNFRVKATEMRVYSEAYGYAGTLDLLGYVHDDKALVDIKTGVESPATAVQVAAYWMCLPPSVQDGLKCYTLYLKPDKYNLVPINNSAQPLALLEASQDFVAALRVYRFRQQHNLLPTEEQNADNRPE